MKKILYLTDLYFINDKLEYALYAPDKNKRWDLKRYDFTQKDKEFAEKFIRWKHYRKWYSAC